MKKVGFKFSHATEAAGYGYRYLFASWRSYVPVILKMVAGMIPFLIFLKGHVPLPKVNFFGSEALMVFGAIILIILYCFLYIPFFIKIFRHTLIRETFNSAYFSLLMSQIARKYFKALIKYFLMVLWNIIGYWVIIKIILLMFVLPTTLINKHLAAFIFLIIGSPLSITFIVLVLSSPFKYCLIFPVVAKGEKMVFKKVGKLAKGHKWNIFFALSFTGVPILLGFIAFIKITDIEFFTRFPWVFEVVNTFHSFFLYFLFIPLISAIAYYYAKFIAQDEAFLKLASKKKIRTSES